MAQRKWLRQDMKTTYIIIWYIGVEYEKDTDEQTYKIHATAKELYLATCFFLGCEKASIW